MLPLPTLWYSGLGKSSGELSKNKKPVPAQIELPGASAPGDVTVV